MFTIQDEINSFLAENKHFEDINVKIDIHENSNGVQTYIANILYSTTKKAKDYHNDGFYHGDNT